MRGGFFALKHCGFMDVIQSFAAHTTQNSTERSITPNFTLTKGELFQCFEYLLASTLELSKEPDNTKFFLEEGLISFLLEILEVMIGLGEALPMKLVISVATIIKNITSDSGARKKLLEVKNVEKFSKLLRIMIINTPNHK